MKESQFIKQNVKTTFALAKTYLTLTLYSISFVKHKSFGYIKATELLKLGKTYNNI